MVKKETRKIYVLETKQTYDSLAAAARAVGVDPSNARKALKQIGRDTAGGYHFSYADSVEQKVTQLAEQKKIKIKKQNVDKEKKALVEIVHDMLVDLNKRSRNAKKEDLYGADEVLQRLMQHTDQWGANKTGGYKTDRTYIRQYTSQQLKTFLDVISAEKEGYVESIYNRMNKNRNLASYAAQFGLRGTEDMKKYWHLLPAMFEMFANAKVQSELKYETIKNDIYDAMQGSEDPEDILDYITDLNKFYKGNTKEDLTEILDKHSETVNEWADQWEDIPT